MQRAAVDGIQLEFETRGHGDPVVLIHGSVIADAHAPLMHEPSLASLRLVRYRRRGFGGSTHSPPQVSIRRQAADCAALLRHLDIARAHVVGHSYGGAIAMQLAHDAPHAVNSLALLEPALIRFVPSGAKMMEAFASTIAAYQRGEKRRAIADFLSLVCGPGWPETIAKLPAALEMAVADADNFFGVEVPALQEWNFGPEQASRLDVPVLAMVGAHSEPVFREGHKQLQFWFPRADTVEIPKASHMLQMENSRAVAEALAGFFHRHAMGPSPV
jgi:pimeloyl-ACP methyl ester carboxylesterase